MRHIESVAASQIENDQGGKLINATASCPAASSIEPKAGTKFDCNISARPVNANVDSVGGSATVVLNDPEGKTFSLDYKLTVHSRRSGDTTLSGTHASIG
ncbi:hypothetical protein A5791_14595 [Mycobacterium sp. 852002-51163_SCH5372311]|nr:hypothetical protein A5791_14595 [Mycobacterium sp. 852002-51163_SCH5372311]